MKVSYVLMKVKGALNVNNFIKCQVVAEIRSVRSKLHEMTLNIPIVVPVIFSSEDDLFPEFTVNLSFDILSCCP